MASTGIDAPGHGGLHKHEKHELGDGGVVEVRDEDVLGASELSMNDWDMRDMKRLGKKQEFKRNFSFFSTMGFISVYMATWEIVIIVLSAGVYDGGFAGLFWAFLGTCICYSTVVASLAEMASMAPTTAGQYHWVSEFSPPSMQKVFSYASGWMSTLAWIASQASGGFLVATLIEVMINVTKPDFAFSSWQYTLIALGFLLSTIIFNTLLATILPPVETVALFLHVVGFVIVIVPLWVLAPKNSAKEVFTTFVNESGYSGIGTAILLNQVNSLYCILGSDTAVHIAEEVDDASLVVPRCMWWSYVLNFFLALITIITMLFCFGPLDQAVNADIPYLVLFQNTNNNGVALTLLIILLILIYVGNVSVLTAVSRETWAFARDKGLPFSTWISKIDRKRRIPTNAVWLCTVISCILTLINLGSSLAFSIIVSLSLLALLSTYLISIGCILLKRIRGEPLPPARWSLGRYGVLINGFAFAYCLFAMIWCAFPATLPVDTSNANWGPAVWAGVILLAIVVYLVYGKTHYTPPVMFVEGHRTTGVGIQST